MSAVSKHLQSASNSIETVYTYQLGWLELSDAVWLASKPGARSLNESHCTISEHDCQPRLMGQSVMQ